MLRWGDFVVQAPELAQAGWRLFRADQIPIGFIATLSGGGRPRLSPVCPIFAGDGIYISAGATTTKARDLAERGWYALHAFLAANDEELQISGRAMPVEEPKTCASVHAAIKFGAFKRSDPIFELHIDRALWVWWENVGKPNTRPIRRSWFA